MKAHKTTFIIDQMHIFGYDRKDCAMQQRLVSVSGIDSSGTILSGASVSTIFDSALREVDVYGCKVKF